MHLGQALPTTSQPAISTDPQCPVLGTAGASQEPPILSTRALKLSVR